MKNPAPFGKGNDYMSIQAGQHDQSDNNVPAEPGNNGGPLSDGTKDKGTADFQGDGSYGSAMSQMEKAHDKGEMNS